LTCSQDIAREGAIEVAPSASLIAMTAKRSLLALAALALAALLAVGLSQLGGSPRAAPSPLSLAQMRARLSGSPPPLASLHAQAGQILDGGLPALRARLATLRGRPIVINKWASWCAPCRAEFGVFQRVAVATGRRVAFLGIDSGEPSRARALAFLRSFPVSYPSYYDRSGRAGEAITDSAFTPVTVFYDSRGSQYIHQGPYSSTTALEADVRRYALHA
jgi:cytochrome c biogenesis protein CcmG, thiol:disulfide interchange protein DsbE